VVSVKILISSSKAKWKGEQGNKIVQGRRKKKPQGKFGKGSTEEI
jgi:hypothetical protein